MRLLTTIFLFLFYASSLAQIKVLSSKNKSPVAFANVVSEDHKTAVSCSENGIFNQKPFPNSRKVEISCVGFETKTIAFSDLQNEVYLNEISIALPEVMIKKTKFRSIPEKQPKISFFTSGYATNSAVSFSNKWRAGRMFPFEDSFEETPLIHKIQVATSSSIRGASFKLSLYKKSISGFLGEPLHHSFFIVQVPKGKHYSELDLSNQKLTFPEEGLIVVCEWIDEPQNWQIKTVTQYETKKKVKETFLLPVFLYVNEGVENGLIYSLGNWTTVENFNKKIPLNCKTPNIRITLSN